MEMKKCRLKTLSLRPINIVGHIAPPHNRKKKKSQPAPSVETEIFFILVCFFQYF